MISRDNWFLAPLAMFCVAVFLYPAWLIVQEPHLLNYTEGILFHAGTQVLDGNSLYQNINEPPYNYFSYGPLHPYVGALFMAVFGEDIVVLRVLTGLCELAIVITAYVIFRIHGAARSLAVMGALLTMAVLGFHKFHMIARVDMLILAFEFAGLAALLAFLRGGGKRTLLYYGLAMVAALLGKVTTVIMVAAVGLLGLLELRHDRGRGMAMVAASVAVGLGYAAVALLWTVATEGEFFRFQVTYQAASPMCNPLHQDCGNNQLLLKALWARYSSFLVFALLSAVLRRGRRHVETLTVIAAAWLCWAVLKDGADLNYTLEPVILACLVVGLSLPRWRAVLSQLRIGRWRVPVALSLSILLLLALLSPLRAELPVRDWLARDVLGSSKQIWVIELMGGDADRMPPGPFMDLLGEDARRERRALAELMSRASGVVLSEEPLFAAQADQEVWLADPFQMPFLEAHGYFDSSGVVAACREGRVEWVFAGWRLLRIDGLREVLESHFEPVYRTRAPVGTSFWTVYKRR